MNEQLFRHILVPTDGSENSIAAARVALRIARALSSQVTLLYVVDTTVLSEVVRYADHSPADTHQEFRRSGRQYLHYLERLAQEEGVLVQREIREGEPHEEIVATADGVGADLIVMGHVGRRGPRRILIGSVTERVLEFAHCPVLVVKTVGKEAGFLA
jgi:nucleotide-binding universal stress UspA family protein